MISLWKSFPIISCLREKYYYYTLQATESLARARNKFFRTVCVKIVDYCKKCNTSGQVASIQPIFSRWLAFPGAHPLPVLAMLTSFLWNKKGIRPPPQNAVAFSVNVIHVLVITNGIHNPLTQFVMQLVALVIKLHSYLQSDWPGAGMSNSKPSTWICCYCLVMSVLIVDMPQWTRYPSLLRFTSMSTSFQP